MLCSCCLKNVLTIHISTINKNGATCIDCWHEKYVNRKKWEKIESPIDKMCIYVLIDPRDDVVKYVGSTFNPTLRRHFHCYGMTQGNKKKRDWHKEMKDLNMVPLFKIVEFVNFNDTDVKEREYIKKYKTWKYCNRDAWTKYMFKDEINKWEACLHTESIGVV